MPQMAPLLWLYLFSFFLISLSFYSYKLFHYSLF